MRPLIICLFIVLCGLGFLLSSQAPGVEGAEVPAPVAENAAEENADRSASLIGVAGQRGRAGESSSRQVDPAQVAVGRGDSVVEAQPMATLTVRLVGRERPVAGSPPVPLPAGSVESLRIKARCLTMGIAYGGALESPGLAAQIEVPAGGRYRVWVDPESVPEGFVGSGVQRLGGLDTTGIGGAHIGLQGEEGAEVTLYLFKTVGLGGRVIGPAGEGLGGVTVRAQGLRPGLDALAHNEVSEPDGSFQFNELLPLVYGIQVVDLGAHDGQLRALPMPPQRLFDLQYGPYTGVQVSLAGGRLAVQGRVVDEFGVAFGGVSVRAYYTGDLGHGVALDFERTFDWDDQVLIARSDGRGHFALERLHGIPIRVQVGAEEAANGEGRRAQFVPPPVDVALGPSSSTLVDVGDLVLHRSRRFTIHGRVQLTESELDGRRLKLRKLTVVGATYPVGATQEPRPGREQAPRVHYEPKTGSITISCEANTAECLVRIGVRGRPDTIKEYRFSPEADVVLEGEVFAFP